MPPIITNVDQRALAQTKFPAEFNQKIDTSKINIDVIRNWGMDELSKILSFDDDVVINMIFDSFNQEKSPHIKKIQISMNEFLGAKQSAAFCKDLWNLCLEAQADPLGVPPKLLEMKKAELMREQNRKEEELKRIAANRRRYSSEGRDVDAARFAERRGSRDDRGVSDYRRDRGPPRGADDYGRPDQQPVDQARREDDYRRNGEYRRGGRGSRGGRGGRGGKGRNPRDRSPPRRGSPRPARDSYRRTHSRSRSRSRSRSFTPEYRRRGRDGTLSPRRRSPVDRYRDDAGFRRSGMRSRPVNGNRSRSPDRRSRYGRLTPDSGRSPPRLAGRRESDSSRRDRTPPRRRDRSLSRRRSRTPVRSATPVTERPASDHTEAKTRPESRPDVPHG